jgi:hypothetical protein
VLQLLAGCAQGAQAGAGRRAALYTDAGTPWLESPFLLSLKRAVACTRRDEALACVALAKCLLLAS